MCEQLLTILVHQVASTVRAAQGGLFEPTISSRLLLIAGAEGHNHGVPRKLHHISIIQQYQINDLQYRTLCVGQLLQACKLSLS